MACRFADKCIHYNAWWCNINHNSCGTAKAMNEPAPAPVPVSGVSDDSTKSKNRKNRKKGGE